MQNSSGRLDMDSEIGDSPDFCIAWRSGVCVSAVWAALHNLNEAALGAVSIPSFPWHAAALTPACAPAKGKVSH